MNFRHLFVAAQVVAAMGAGSVQAAVAFSENFDAGTVNFTQGDPYWSDAGEGNGVFLSGGPGGSGKYLDFGTAFAGPPADLRFYISASFAVAMNTNYTLTFDVYNHTAPYYYWAPINASINGNDLGTLRSPDGNTPFTWDTSTFSFNWNSGANTTATITLSDMFDNGPWDIGANYLYYGYGNDFGVDNIALIGEPAAVPEPVSLALVGLGLTGLGFSRRRKTG